MKQRVEDWHPAGIQVTGERKIKIESGKRKQKQGVLLRCIYLYLCLLGTLFTLRQDLKIDFHMLPVAGALLLFVLLAVLKNIWKTWGRYVYTGGYVLFFGLAAINWKHLTAGWAVLENGIRHQLSAYYGVTLAEKQVILPGEQGELLLLLLFVLFFWSMETTVVRKGRTGLLILSEILILLLELLCGCRFLQPGIFLIGGGLLALVAMGYRQGQSSQRILYHTGLWAGGIILCLSVLAVTAGSVLADQTSGWNTWLYKNVQEKTSQLVRTLQSQNGLFGNHNPTADGSLDNHPVDQKNETDLVVHTSGKPEHNIYLRGFTGGTYQGSYWSPVETERFDSSFTEADSGWQVQNILYRYIRSRSAEAEGTITVTREHPAGDYGYVPYGFQVPDDENVRGDGGYASAQKEISYTGYVNWSEWMDPQAAEGEESEIESAYKDYVAKEYLKVPVEGLERLKAYCAQQNLQSVQEVIDFVIRDVQDGRTYSMDLEKVPPDQDFAEYFFFEQRKGYCIHYATTATLMLRMLGVPARYVTGYVIPSEAFASESDGYTARVPDTQAHAWVEVYRSGKGWIPVEVTPGYEDTKNGNQQQGQESTGDVPVVPEVSQAPQEETTPEPVPSVQEEPEENQELSENENAQKMQDAPAKSGSAQEADKVSGRKKTVSVVAVAFLLAVLLAAAGMGEIRLRRRKIMENRKQRFFQEDINQGICEISYDIYQMLWDARAVGILPELAETESDQAFAGQVEQMIPWMEKESYGTVLKTVEKASYGPDLLTKEDRDICYQFYKKTEAWLWKQMPEKKRFWWKYMRGYSIS